MNGALAWAEWAIGVSARVRMDASPGLEVKRLIAPRERYVAHSPSIREDPRPAARTEGVATD